MLRRHSQGIRPPERAPTPFGLKLKEALEKAQREKAGSD